MQEAYDSWAKSEHSKLNCHDCHHLTIPEQNQLLISFVMHRPTKVPERHKGQVIVSSKTCNECHTSKNAKRINKSLFHAKHVYMEQIECTECHGEVKADKSGLHHFLPTEKFCTKCHTGKAVHGEGMGGLACLNCHTDRTKDLKPGRMKCLYCHSADESIKKRLKDDATMDVRFFQPEPATIKKAIKIVFDEKAPMQFYCYECHKPHTQGKVKPGEQPLSGLSYQCAQGRQAQPSILPWTCSARTVTSRISGGSPRLRPRRTASSATSIEAPRLFSRPFVIYGVSLA